MGSPTLKTLSDNAVTSHPPQYPSAFCVSITRYSHSWLNLFIFRLKFITASCCKAFLRFHQPKSIWGFFFWTRGMHLPHEFLEWESWLSLSSGQQKGFWFPPFWALRMHVYFGASYRNELRIQPIAVQLVIIFCGRVFCGTWEIVEHDSWKQTRLWHSTRLQRGLIKVKYRGAVWVLHLFL